MEHLQLQFVSFLMSNVQCLLSIETIVLAQSNFEFLAEIDSIHGKKTPATILFISFYSFFGRCQEQSGPCHWQFIYFETHRVFSIQSPDYGRQFLNKTTIRVQVKHLYK